MTDLSPTRRARRDRIVAAARDVFRTDGFRGATMEGIASAAGLSKVTLYGYFPDKEAAFLAVAEGFATEIERRFAAALAAPGPAAGAVTAALVAKHAAVAETVRNASDPRDLFAARERIAAGVFEALDARLIAAIASRLAADGRADSARLAHLVFSAALGLANATVSPVALAADIDLLVRAVLSYE
jgi:AcrR family transcriptional regulator